MNIASLRSIMLVKVYCLISFCQLDMFNFNLIINLFVFLQERTGQQIMQKNQSSLSLDNPNPHSFSFASRSEQHEQSNNEKIKKLNPLEVFMKEQAKYLKHNPYQFPEQYKRWQSFLNRNRSIVPSEVFLEYIDKFLQYFPYSRKYWLQWISLKKTLMVDPQTAKLVKESQYEIYQKALLKNPKCFQIWQQYITLLHEKMIHGQTQTSENKGTTPIRANSSPDIKMGSNTPINSQVFRRELERAIIEIGADSRSSQFYKYYYPLLNQSSRYEFYKKIFTRNLDNLEEFYDLFQKWLLQDCSDDLAKTLYFRQSKGASKSNIDASAISAIKEFLKMEVTKSYQKTLKYRQMKEEYDQKIKYQYFEDRFHLQGSSHEVTQVDSREVKKSYEAFQNLILFERDNQGTIQNISYHFQKAINVHFDELELWQEMFHYLENETGKYLKVLNILRNNERLFLSYPSRDLYFYWCDLEERQNPQTAKKMYKTLHDYYIGQTPEIPISLASTFEIFMREIQFEIRVQSIQKAKQIFDQILAHYCSYLSLNPLKADTCYRLISHTIVEYASFVVRFYKDFQYPKKLYKMYFDFLPFNQYLYIEYLEFMKNFENREGYYDELMGIILLGLSKAKKEMFLQRNQEFNETVRAVKQILRSFLGSIYLIKISERKVMEIVEAEITEEN